MPAAQRPSREALRTWREGLVRSGSAISKSRISAGPRLMTVSVFVVDGDSGGCRYDTEVCKTTTFLGCIYRNH